MSVHVCLTVCVEGGTLKGYEHTVNFAQKKNKTLKQLERGIKTM